MIPFSIVPQTFPGYEKQIKNLNFVIIQCTKKNILEVFSYNEHLTGNTSFIETTKTVITPQSWNRLELSGRHTTISMMKEHSIDETTIKKIVGHSGAMTLTERVYTHLDVQVLIDAINKIVGDIP